MTPEAVASRRRRAPRGQGERLREEILSAAERLLIDTGDEQAVSIRAVADAVGVTPPSIYLHFGDKKELMFAVSERQFERLDRVTEEAAAGSTDPLESLRLRGKAYVQFGRDNPEQYRILFMGKSEASPPGFDEDRLRGLVSFDHLVGAVQRCMDAGAIPQTDAFFVALGMWIAVHGLTSLLIAKPDFPWPDPAGLVDHFCSVHVAGLQAVAHSPS
ncbi:MAG: TetR/AcrR family transcriptional regulator [Actinomycetota bacterium]